MFEPLLFNVIRVEIPILIGARGISATDATAYYLDKLESTLATHHQQVAAMVIEPLVQAQPS